MRRGQEHQQQSRKDRRDESAGWSSMGRRKYASVGTMDRRRKMAREAGSMQRREDITQSDE